MNRNELNMPSQTKISAMLLEVADGYIQMGNDIPERLNYLRSALNAWNIACLPEEQRDQAIVKLLDTFKKYNPGSTIQNISNVESDIRQLVDQKIKLYPSVNVRLVDCAVEIIDGKEQVFISFLTPAPNEEG